jgi:hypothetical protein
MMESMISEYVLRRWLGASPTELAKLRALFPECDGGDYPQAECARALLAIRKGSRGRDAITEQHKASQTLEQANSPNLLQRLRRGVSRKVPPQ